MSQTILAVETSSDACSVALLIEDQIHEKFEIAPRQHNALILPMIETLLRENDLSLQQLDAVAFGRGPGSFTGLRVAASIVQGIAFAADLPVIPVSTLQALAQGARRELGSSQVIAAIDARINEIYWAAFIEDDRGVMRMMGEEIVCAPEEVVFNAAGKWTGVGSGWDTYQNIMDRELSTIKIRKVLGRYVRASHVVKLAEVIYQENGTVEPEEALPTYLRDQVVKERQHG